MKKNNRLETLVAILIAATTVIGALVAWRTSVAADAGGDADFAGLKASLNASETESLNYVNAYEHYGAYINYWRNKQNGDEIGKEIDQLNAKLEKIKQQPTLQPTLRPTLAPTLAPTMQPTIIVGAQAEPTGDSAIEQVTDEPTEAVEAEVETPQPPPGDPEIEKRIEALSLMQSEAYDLSTSNQELFPNRFLNRDGNYNVKRELGELWSDAAREKEMDPQPYYAESDKYSTKTSDLLMSLTILGIALVFFTLMEPATPKLKVPLAGLGVMCLTGGMVIALIAEFTIR